MDSLTGTGTVSSTGRATPSRGRPLMLDDAEWLAGELVYKGERQIAADLGCDRKTVRAAIRRHGLTPFAPGRRRGVTSAGPSDRVTLAEDRLADETETLVLDRYRAERRPGGPSPSEDLLASRLRAAYEALAARDDWYDSELIGIASAAMLIRQHRQQLRGIR